MCIPFSKQNASIVVTWAPCPRTRRARSCLALQNPGTTARRGASRYWGSADSGTQSAAAWRTMLALASLGASSHYRAPHDGLDARGHFLIQLCQKGERIKSAVGARPVVADTVPGARVRAGKTDAVRLSVQLIVLKLHRPARLRGRRSVFCGGPGGCKTRFLVDAQPHFLSPERARVKGGQAR